MVEKSDGSNAQIREIAFFPPIILSVGTKPLTASEDAITSSETISQERILRIGQHADIPYRRDIATFPNRYLLRVRRKRITLRADFPSNQKMSEVIGEDGEVVKITRRRAITMGHSIDAGQKRVIGMTAPLENEKLLFSLLLFETLP